MLSHLQITRIQTKITKLFTCRYASILFIPRERTTEQCVVLNPHFQHINDDYFTKMRNNVNLRKLDINIDKVEILWRLFNDLSADKIKLETDARQLVHDIKNHVVTDPKITEQKIANKKLQLDLIKNDIKLLKTHLDRVEYSAKSKILSLPNFLHKRTPSRDQVVHEKLVKQHNPEKYEKIEKYIDFYNARCYYLKGPLALGSIYVMDRVIYNFRDYKHTSTSDFVKSVIVEGCGLNHESTDTFVVDDTETNDTNQLHLVGSATIMSFMANFARTSMYKSMLPLRYYTIGRRYIPLTSKLSNSEDFNVSLTNVEQSNVFRTITITDESTTSVDMEIDDLLSRIISIYDRFECSYRVTLKSIEQLDSYECLRYDIEMPVDSCHVTVGSLSCSTDFISKRLAFNYLDGKEKKHPNVVSATVLDYSKFVECYLKQKSLENFIALFSVQNHE